MKLYKLLFSIAAIAFFATNCNQKTITEKDYSKANFTEIEADAKGGKVNLLMWTGDPLINSYMNNFVVPTLKSQYNISLNITAAQGAGITSVLRTELEAGKKNSDVDMCWINGETFYQLRQLNVLYGPFVEKLPNAQYINFKNEFINTDFQKPIEGMECPWGNVQMALIYNSEKVPTPPKNYNELESYVKQNPGKFTFGDDFSGLTFLKAWLINIAGGKDSLSGNFDEAKYKKCTAILFDRINKMKSNFWKEGKTFPTSVAAMHQMFANGELYFTMSNNDGEVDNKVQQGIFPAFAKSYVIDGGSIQNSHYMGIIKTSANKAAAMVVANFLISPQAQLQKQKQAVWGDGTVLNIDVLPQAFKDSFAALPARVHGPNRAEIQPKALMEPAPEYMTRLADDFRKYVIEK